MNIIDLTMTINETTPVYPGDPKPEFTRVATCEKDGWNEHRICINTHFGTHIDAPWHMLRDGKRLSDFTLEKFIGRAVLFDVREQKEINTNLDVVQEGDILLLRTDYTQYANSLDFFKNNPVISKELARKIVDKKISIVGIDSYTPDNEPFEIHKFLLSHDILILENLVNLDKIKVESFMIFILPLKLDKIDGSPCRVFAQIIN